MNFIRQISIKKILLLNLMVTLYSGILFCMDNPDSSKSKSEYINSDSENENINSDPISSFKDWEDSIHLEYSEQEDDVDDSDYIPTLEDEEINENDSEILKSLNLIYTKIKQINYLEKLRFSELRIQKKDQFIEEIHKNIKKVIQLIKNDDDKNFKEVIQEMKNINFDLQKYLKGNRTLTAQHLALVLNNILPLIAAIQNIAQANITMQMNNPRPNKKLISLNKKIIIGCLAISVPVVGVVWYLCASGIAVIEVAVSLKDLFTSATGFLLT
jgi:hypothetical protein